MQEIFNVIEEKQPHFRDFWQRYLETQVWTPNISGLSTRNPNNMPLGTVFPDLVLLGAQAHKELMVLLFQDLDCFTSTHPLEQKWVWAEVKMKTGIQSFRITVQN